MGDAIIGRVSLFARTTYTTYCGRLLVMALCLVGWGGCPELVANAGQGVPPPPVRKSGKKLPPAPVPLLPSEEAWTLALPSPPSAGGAMDRERVYVPLSSDRIVAFSRQTGALIWMRDIETAWPPLSDGDTLYVVASDELHALDARTGDTRWRSSILRPAMGPMATAGDLVIVLMEPDDVLSFRRTDGAEIWRTSMGGTAGRYSMTAGMDAVYVTAPGGRVAALSLNEGKKVWEQMLPGVLSQAAAARARVFIGSNDNFLYALDAESGKLAWKRRSGGDVIGAAAGRDLVYYASLDNLLWAVNRGNGNQRWKKPTAVRPVLPPRIVGDEVLIIGSAPTLSTYDAKTGTPANTYAAPAEVAGDPLVDPELRAFEVAVVIILRDGRMIALRPQSITFTEAPRVPLTTLPGKPLPRERLP
jgi:outer membrane protein assembly factor BamB